MGRPPLSDRECGRRWTRPVSHWAAFGFPVPRLLSRTHGLHRLPAASCCSLVLSAGPRVPRWFPEFRRPPLTSFSAGPAGLRHGEAFPPRGGLRCLYVLFGSWWGQWGSPFSWSRLSPRQARLPDLGGGPFSECLLPPSVAAASPPLACRTRDSAGHLHPGGRWEGVLPLWQRWAPATPPVQGGFSAACSGADPAARTPPWGLAPFHPSPQAVGPDGTGSGEEKESLLLPNSSRLLLWIKKKKNVQEMGRVFTCVLLRGTLVSFSVAVFPKNAQQLANK